jgi:hypothetical protein
MERGITLLLLGERHEPGVESALAIEGHLRTDISLDDIAAASGVSWFHMSRAFSEMLDFGHALPVRSATERGGAVMPLTNISWVNSPTASPLVSPILSHWC